MTKDAAREGETAVQLAERYADKWSDRNDANDDWCVRHNCFLDGYRAAQPADHDGIVKAARELVWADNAVNIHFDAPDSVVLTEEWSAHNDKLNTARQEAWDALRRALASETVDRDRKLTTEEVDQLREFAIDYRGALFPLKQWKNLIAYVESLLNPINQRNERDGWTLELPTEPGWYWAQFRDELEILSVERQDDGLIFATGAAQPMQRIEAFKGFRWLHIPSPIAAESPTTAKIAAPTGSAEA